MNLTFNSGNQDNMLCVDVPINDDNLCEADEMFSVSLTTVDPAVTLDPDSGTVTIVDDDGMLASMTYYNICTFIYTHCLYLQLRRSVLTDLVTQCRKM